MAHSRQNNVRSLKKQAIIKTNIHYFSTTLKEAMYNIPMFPVTVVEAASGYGKTTCIRYFFKSFNDADVRWISFSENDTAIQAWERWCHTLKRIDADTGTRLSALGLPSLYNIDEISQLLCEIRCEEPTYIVFDNFQCIQKYFTKGIWEAFLFNNSEYLHIVVLTQIIHRESEFLTHCAKCLYLSSEELTFKKTDIVAYFKKSGVILTNSQLDFLLTYSEGWIAPLYLQLLHYSKHQEFQSTVAIHAMIENVILDTLEKRQRQLLIALSFFDTFTQEQLIYFDGSIEASNYRFEKIPLLAYNDKEATYTFHSILREVLQLEFSKLSKTHQTQIVLQSAQWYASTQNIANAILMYCKIEQYNKVLSLIDSSLIFDNISLRYSKESYLLWLRKIALTHIEESVYLYPLAYILIAFEFFTQNCYEEYGMICQMLHAAIEDEGIERDSIEKIKGELALIESFSVFNHIAKMGLYQQKAYNLLQGKSSAILPRDPWTFGNPSVVSLYWSAVGKLEEHMEDMGRCMPLYSSMVKGHGMGADTIFRAEIALFRGEEHLAENLCYKGISQARSTNQESLYLAAVFVLQRVAIFYGSKHMYELCQSYLYDSEKTRAIHYELSEIALINEHMHLQLQVQFDHEEAIKKVIDKILPMSSTFGFCLLARALLLQGKHVEVQMLFEEAMGVAEALNSQLTKVYFTLYMAIAKMQANQIEMAQEYLSKAFDIALPDKIILPFAENYDLLKKVSNETGLEVPLYVTQVCNRYKKGVQLLSKSLYSNEALIELTPSEYEVYKLAALQKKNKDIANTLFVSENTVKTHLAHIYSKLGVNSKKELHSL